MTQKGKIAILWRGDRATRDTATAETSRFVRVFEALARAGIAAEPAVFDESFANEVHAQLLGVDGVLVWVDPLSEGRTRAILDPLLRDVASKGPWVSAHPDVILKMGVKEVLHRTRHLGWGTDTRLYRSPDQFRAEFPACLANGAPRVIKRNRGNGGQGVWKVELRGDGRSVDVLHAKRGSLPETLALDAFIERCSAYFSEDNGCIIDQPFQARLPDGMIRCYVAEDRVAGFGHQLVKALIPPPPEGPDAPSAQPGPRIMHGKTAEPFQRLRRLMDNEWIPAMAGVLGIDRRELPVIWDADFLYGPATDVGDDTYVLCEINVSSVFAIPDQAPQEIAKRVAARLQSR
ncbi:MAG: Cj0069 family protein [Alphaproteobacteria bacterium]|nr:Cj0069 family protein [Alphaproteobacteria bacterium]